MLGLLQGNRPERADLTMAMGQMKQEQLTEAWNLLSAKAILWGWESRSYGKIQALIKDGRFVWSRKVVVDRERGPWQALQMTPDELARAMQVLQAA